MSSRFATLVLLCSMFCVAGCGGSKDKGDATADTGSSPAANNGNNSGGGHGDSGSSTGAEENNAGHGDSGHGDSGHGDSGHGDSGHGDSGHGDSGHGDSGHDDSGHDDSGHDDSGHDDSGHDDSAVATNDNSGGGSEHGDGEHGDGEHGDSEHGDAGNKDLVAVKPAKVDEGHGDGDHGEGGLTALKPSVETPGEKPGVEAMPALTPLPGNGEAGHGDGENTVATPGGLTGLPEQNGLNAEGEGGTDKPAAVKEFMPKLREDLPSYAAVLLVRKVINDDETGMSDLISPTSRGLAAELRAEDNSEAMTKAGELMGDLTPITSRPLPSGEVMVNFRIGKTERILRFTVKKVRSKYVVHNIQDIQIGK